MATKVDRTHIRDPFDVKANYHNGEVVLTFISGLYPDIKEVVIHMKVWFMPHIVGQLKKAYSQAQNELDAFVRSVSGGV